MNFRTNNLPIDQKNPFEDDLFGRKHFAYKLNNILRKTEGVTVFIHSPWGQGKNS